MKKIKIIFISILFLGLFGLAESSSAAPWTGILDADRAVDWSLAGRTIPTDRTKCGSTMAAYSGASSAINNALSLCAANTYLELGAGTFILSGPIVMKSDVTLRGQGPTQTILDINGGGCASGAKAAVCMGVAQGAWYFTTNQGSFTGNFSKGSNTLTLMMDRGSAPVVGTLLNINQLNDTGRTGSMYVYSAQGDAICPGSSVGAYGTRCYAQVSRITNISGSGPYTVTFYPPLQGDYWTSGKSPKAVWEVLSSQIKNAGMEDLKILFDYGDSINRDYIDYVTYISACDGCWIKNVTQIETPSGNPGWGGGRAHVAEIGNLYTSIENSYFYGTRKAHNLSYGIEQSISSFSRVQNNIFHRVAAPIVPGGALIGNVWAYNYFVDNYCDPTGGVACSAGYQMAGIWGHDAGHMLNLVEGNDAQAFTTDTLHGTGGNLNTLFRNRIGNLDSGMTSNIHTLYIGDAARYFNVIGNVFGQAGSHNDYSAISTDQANCETTIYAIGHRYFPCWGGTTEEANKVWSSMMRWGNYDVVTGSVLWNSGDVPSSDAYYPNAAPASQTLPASFYLTSKPSWFGSVAWPPVGPDVTDGNMTSGSGAAATLGGHAYKIPARLCYENTSKTNGVLNFNANNCYSSAGGGDTTPPSAPSGLSVQ